MDPNLPQPSNPQPQPKRKFQALLITIIIIILTGSILYSPKIFKKELQPVQTQAPTPVPVIATFKIQTLKGVITTLTKNSLSIKPESTDSANLTFTIKDTVNIQRLVSGTLEGPKTKLEKVKISNLKVGQRIYLIANDKNEATTVVILK